MTLYDILEVSTITSKCLRRFQAFFMKSCNTEQRFKFRLLWSPLMQNVDKDFFEVDFLITW